MDPRDADGWIQTFTGRKVNLADIRPDDIDIQDIAHALSLQCRFSGHTKKHYSIAQHCVLVNLNCPAFYQLWGLLHDASEAYLLDLPRPIKHRCGYETYRADEERCMQAVSARFGLSLTMPECVRRADELLLVTEARDLMAPLAPGWRFQVANGYTALEEKIVPWDMRLAEIRFLERFATLYSELQKVRRELALT